MYCATLPLLLLAGLALACTCGPSRHSCHAYTGAEFHACERELRALDTQYLKAVDMHNAAIDKHMKSYGMFADMLEIHHNLMDDKFNLFMQFESKRLDVYRKMAYKGPTVLIEDERAANSTVILAPVQLEWRMFSSFS